MISDLTLLYISLYHREREERVQALQMANACANECYPMVVDATPCTP